MWQWNNGICELYHYGVKGMKWGVHKAKVPPQKKNKKLSEMSSKEYQRLGYKKRMAIAQKHGSKAMDAYVKLANDYRKKYVQAKSENDRIKLEEEYDNKLDREVTSKLQAAGYEWVTRGAGSYNGKNVLNLQFGRVLADTELTSYGEKYVDSFIIDSNHKKVADADDWG